MAADRPHPVPRVLLALFMMAVATGGAAQAATYRYEGRLDERGRPAEGRYDLRLLAFADASSTAPTAPAIEFPGVTVAEGAFALAFDLPPAATLPWLELAVRAAGEAAWTVLPGRRKAVDAMHVGACWSSTGDAGSDPAVNFLGTLDAQPLVLRTANTPSLRIEPSALLAGGLPATANVVGGSRANGVDGGARGATVGGGGMPGGDSDPDLTLDGPNRVGGHYGTVSGGYANEARGVATVGGGASNTAAGTASTVGGGERNLAQGQFASVGGGENNTAGGSSSTVAGGGFNLAPGLGAAIGGGASNQASSTVATVAGGFGNQATGQGSAVGGGQGNTASGAFSTVGGGEGNCAGAAWSWAGGRDALVRPAAGAACGPVSGGGEGDRGTFLWSDSLAPRLVSVAPNMFHVRAGGGVYFNATGGAPGSVDVVLGTRAAAAGGDDDFNLGLRSRNRAVSIELSDLFGSLRFSGATAYELGLGASGGNHFLTTSTGAYLTFGGAWTNASSRTLKTDVAAIEPGALLDRLLDLPVSRWRYAASPDEGEHVGPMAEDFHAAFGLGADDRTISSVDLAGVAIGGLQGLHARLSAEHAALRAEHARLLGRIQALERRLAAAGPAQD